MRRAGSLARLPLILAVTFGAACVALPLLVMLVETVWTEEGLSLAAWGALLRDPVDRIQLRYSLELGLAATAVALACGLGHAWLTERTDLPGGRWLGPLGVAPLVVPPIFVAMGFADVVDVAGFWPCSGLLGVCYAPFVAVLAARGLRAVDGRSYEAALLARGRFAADRLLLRAIAPEVAAGCLFAFLFVVSEHGVPEFLTVKGKTWHTYAEGVFGRWTRRAVGGTHQDQVGPIVAAVPLVAIVGLSLWLALRLRARTTIASGFEPLPVRRLGRWRWPGLLLPVTYLGTGVGVPILVMARWASGSTDLRRGMSLGTLRESFRLAVTEALPELGRSFGVALAVAVLLTLVALPLARRAARGWPGIDWLCALPAAVPAVLLGIGFVKVFNSPWLAPVYDRAGDFYDSAGVLVAAYMSRFLPFAVLTLSHATRRIDRALEEAARLTSRGAMARTLCVDWPLVRPAAISAGYLAFVLALRELDLAVVLPAGNGTVVRRLSNVVHFGGENMGGALALLLLLVAALPPLVVWLVSGRRLVSLS